VGPGKFPSYVRIRARQRKPQTLRTDDNDTVTGWIKGLGSSRHEHVSRRLWDRYFTKIARLAQGRLRSVVGCPSDGEDVALSVFESFFRGAAAGRFERLDSREDLWRLLVTIASRKAMNAERDERRQKRGGLVDFADPEILNEIAGLEPTPEFAALVADEARRLFESLADDSLREVVRLRLEGYSNDEIAKALDCGLRTVERKLAVIRKRWAAEGNA
jgi:RNA polymerase sigma factor (sigma-70 family)